MRAAALLVVMALSGTAAWSQVVTEMTPEKVREAIALADSGGLNALPNGGFYPMEPNVMGGKGEFHGNFTTPFSRVVIEAIEARKRHRKFTESDVTPDMIAPELRVYTPPICRYVASQQRCGDLANVESVVITPHGSKGRGQTIQPSRSEPVPVNYQDLIGGHWAGHAVVSTFALSALTEANEVRILYDKKLGNYVGAKSDSVYRFKLSKIR
jgi:hypothetical protein